MLVHKGKEHLEGKKVEIAVVTGHQHQKEFAGQERDINLNIVR